MHYCMISLRQSMKLNVVFNNPALRPDQQHANFCFYLIIHTQDIAYYNYKINIRWKIQVL
jgi:hypothetical protein